MNKRTQLAQKFSNLVNYSKFKADSESTLFNFAFKKILNDLSSSDADEQNLTFNSKRIGVTESFNIKSEHKEDDNETSTIDQSSFTLNSARIDVIDTS